MNDISISATALWRRWLVSQQQRGEGDAQLLHNLDTLYEMGLLGSLYKILCTIWQ